MVVRTHKFRGTRYSIKLSGQIDGFCEHPECDSLPSLAIMADLNDIRGLETVVHEALHACDFDKSEKLVTETAHDVARFLWRLGFRHE